MKDHCYWDIDSKCRNIDSNVDCRRVSYTSCPSFKKCHKTYDSCFEKCSDLTSSSDCEDMPRFSDIKCYWDPFSELCSDKKVDCSQVDVNKCKKFFFFFFKFLWLFFI
jgi:hypothetical protein